MNNEELKEKIRELIHKWRTLYQDQDWFENIHDACESERLNCANELEELLKNADEEEKR